VSIAKNSAAVLASSDWKERHPAIRRFWISKGSSHPTQCDSLRNVAAKHLELSKNPRHTPRRFSTTMRKISLHSFLLTGFVATRVRRRERYVTTRDEEATNSGWTKINTCFHSG
jgi:hypothetical protein